MSDRGRDRFRSLTQPYVPIVAWAPKDTLAGLTYRCSFGAVHGKLGFMGIDRELVFWFVRFHYLVNN